MTYLCAMTKKKITSDAEIIGENIRTLRTQKGLSQKEIAATIKVAPTQYSRVENGKVLASVTTLMKIAKVLDVSLDDLVKANGKATQEVSIKDKSLFDKVRLIDELPDEDKSAVLKVLELAVNKKKFKEFVEQQLA